MMNQNDRADSVLEEGLRLPIGFLNTQIDSSNVAGAYKNVAVSYHMMGKKEKSIKILAKAFEFTPMDKGILDLIKQYQEE
jgi:tetratricopeptide (TPR) repeat protein